MKMRAVRIVEPERIAVESVPCPSPKTGEVRIRVEGCGVCASNLGPWHGLPWTEYPLRPGEAGHEAWGVVEALGEGATRFSTGDRVTGLTYRSYAEYDVAPQDHLVPLPASLEGIPGEPIGCAMNIFRRGAVEEGQTVAIIGVGFLGALLTRLASRTGARVIGISRRDFALEIARRMGARDTVKVGDDGRVVEAVRDLTRGELCDRVFECAGHQRSLDLAAELTRVRGRLVLAGYHQDGPRQVNMQLWNWRGLDVINAHERDPKMYLRGIEEGVAAAEAGLLGLEHLITHRLPLDRLDDALRATSERPEGFLKAVVTP